MKAFYHFLTILLVIASSVLGYFLFKDKIQKMMNNVIPHQAYFAETPVIERIDQVGKYVAARFYYNHLHKDKFFREGYIYDDYNDYLCENHGTIELFYDLSKLKETDIKQDNGAISVQLPALEFQFICNPSDRKELIETTPIKDDERVSIDREVELLIRQKCYEKRDELLSIAEKSVSDFLKNMLSAMQFERSNVSIEFSREEEKFENLLTQFEPYDNPILYQVIGITQNKYDSNSGQWSGWNEAQSCNFNAILNDYGRYIKLSLDLPSKRFYIIRERPEKKENNDDTEWFFKAVDQDKNNCNIKLSSPNDSTYATISIVYPEKDALSLILAD